MTTIKIKTNRIRKRGIYIDGKKNDDDIYKGTA